MLCHLYELGRNTYFVCGWWWQMKNTITIGREIGRIISKICIKANSAIKLGLMLLYKANHEETNLSGDACSFVYLFAFGLHIFDHSLNVYEITSSNDGLSTENFNVISVIALILTDSCTIYVNFINIFFN